MSGVAAVLGVAAVVCVSSAVAGEMLQDLKVGHILGGTPAKMQLGDFLGILVASLALYFPLLVLHQGNINRGGIGFGDPQLSAPQAGLMASLAQGIVGHNMLVCYALEDRSPWFILAFAFACGLGSTYGFLQAAWPFGIVEALWALVALRRWRRVSQGER